MTFPTDCPITPLGVSRSRTSCSYWLQDGDIVNLSVAGHDRNALLVLFGPDVSWLEANFPQAETTDFDTTAAVRALIVECARLGVYTRGSSS